MSRISAISRTGSRTPRVARTHPVRAASAAPSRAASRPRRDSRSSTVSSGPSRPRLGQRRLGEPRSDVVLSRHPRRLQLVERDATHHRREDTPPARGSRTGRRATNGPSLRTQRPRRPTCCRATGMRCRATGRGAEGTRRRRRLVTYISPPRRVELWRHREPSRTRRAKHASKRAVRVRQSSEKRARLLSAPTIRFMYATPHAADREPSQCDRNMLRRQAHR